MKPSSKQSAIPILGIFITAAALLLITGLWLGRDEVTRRVPRDHGPHHAFARRLQDELSRLETLYESHLNRLGTNEDRLAEGEVRDQCDRIIGIQRYSLLSRSNRGRSRHLDVDLTGNASLPEPVMAGEESPLATANEFRLTLEQIFGKEDRGWIEQEGRPLFYWVRQTDNRAAVLTIDTESVTQVIADEIRGWSQEAFLPIAVQGGPDHLLSPAKDVIRSSGSTRDGLPDMLLPVLTRFGVWHLAAWDPVHRDVVYRLPVVTGATVASMIVILFGWLAYGHQRRALEDARQRVSFVNRVSHELRSPLTNILLNADLAADGLSDLSRQAAGRVELIREEAGRLNRLVDNVLQFARCDQDTRPSRLQLCAPDDLIEEALKPFLPSLERRGVAVQRRLSAGEPCLLDADRITQILGNLISNVEKYAGEGGLLILRSRRSKEEVILTVADRGPGIAAKDAETVFRPFHRLNTRVDEGATGTGLGLAIARELALEMGGILRLVPDSDSDVEAGAIFELTIPIPVSNRMALS